MNIVLFNSETEGSLTLIENSAGHVVLRVESSQKLANGDYEPQRILIPGEPQGSAAEYVFEWAIAKCRSDAGIEAAQRYLRQWPEGPQAGADEIRQAQAAKDALFEIAESLDAGSPSLDQLNPDELRDVIHGLVDRLAGESPETPAAMLIALRLKLAVTLLHGFVK